MRHTLSTKAAPFSLPTPHHPFPLAACLPAQYVSTAVVSPPVDPNDENANTTKALNTFLPLMVGWFALNVPSGLALYYFSNTLVTMGQQVYLRKLGGAEVSLGLSGWALACTHRLGLQSRLNEKANMCTS